MTRYKISTDHSVSRPDAINAHMMGVQYITTFESEFGGDSAHLDLLADTGATVLRYPGGSVTEEAFADEVFLTRDWNQASVDTDGGQLEFSPMDQFFEAAAYVEADVQLVLPTRVAFLQSAGQALNAETFGTRTEIAHEYFDHLDAFLTEALRLARENNVTISRVEIGNEFWGSGEMSAHEYGHLASKISNFLVEEFPGLNQYLQIVHSANVYSPARDTEVFIESVGGGEFNVHPYFNSSNTPPEHWTTAIIPGVGNGHINNEVIAEAFLQGGGDPEHLNGLVNHIYFGNGLDGSDKGHEFSIKTAYDRFLDMLGVDRVLDYLISEWSPRGEDSDGLMYAHLIVEAFSELVVGGVDQANFWPTTFGNPNVFDRTLINTVDDRLTFGGVVFSWLNDTIGTRPIFDFEDQAGIDIHGFASNSEILMFVSERSGMDHSTFDLDFDSFSVADQYFVIERTLTSDNGSVNDNRAEAVTDVENGYVLTGNTLSTQLRENSLSYIQLQEITVRADRITGAEGNDSIRGDDGDDTIIGGSGDDRLSGQEDNDALLGGDGADLLRGGWGNDDLVGGSGSDTLHGGQNDDSLNGQAGDDVLIGGMGDDTLVGGGGADHFVFDGEGDDVVLDFSLLEADRITLAEPLIGADQQNSQLSFLSTETGTGETHLVMAVDGGSFSFIVDSTNVSLSDVFDV